MIRILHVLGRTNLGGAESRIMELYRSIDKEKVQFDFLVHATTEGYYTPEIEALGGKVYCVPRFYGLNILKYKKALKKFFKEHHDYAMIQGHMTTTASIYLPISKKAGIPVTIAHARNAGVDGGTMKLLLTKYLRKALASKADRCFTCSREAAIDVFGEESVKSGKVWTVPNAINAERFKYNAKVREEVRQQLGINDRYVIGHIGRLDTQKNHMYMLDIFKEITQRDASAVLILIGSGNLEEQIKEKIARLELTDKVMLLGNLLDVERYYQAFDYFLFPSLFEGLPGTVLEAQAAGLHCLISDRITREVALTPLVTYMSIDESASKWADEICRNREAALIREDTIDIIREKGFDVTKQADMMADFYMTGDNPPGHMTNLDK